VSAPFTASKASTSTPSNFKVNATYDTSWTSVPAPPNVVNSLAAAIAILEGTFNLNFTLNIQFGYGTRNNQPMTSRLSQSLYDQTTIPYSTFRSALMVLATTTNSTTAANSLPASDPTGGATIYSSTPSFWGTRRGVLKVTSVSQLATPIFTRTPPRLPVSTTPPIFSFTK
jgi:hypothetical protein